MIFATSDFLKILVLSMSQIFEMAVMIYLMEKTIVYVKGILAEFTFGIWAKLMQLIQRKILI